MRLALLPALAYVGVVGCSSDDPDNPPYSRETANSTDGIGMTGTVGGPTTAAVTSNATGPTVGSTTTAGTSSTTGSGNTTGSTTNGGPLGGTVSGGPTTGGTTSGGPTTGGATTGGFTMGGVTTGGVTTGGFTSGGFTTGDATMGGAGGAANTNGGTTGSSTTGGTPGEPDCSATMPSGGQEHSGNSRGGSGNLAWEIWSNTGEGELTSFEGIPAFRASWNNAGGYLGRIGFEWGNNGEPHTAHGRIHAQFVANKDGDGGGYSYVGMYGWTLNPCVEWYVIEDTFNTLPFNPGGTVNKGQETIDGGTYDIYTRDTTGTGGSRCGDVSNWIQYYSIRTSPRSCGVISLTDHFEAWEAKGMSMAGNLLEAKILAEVGGGVGSVDFPVANVTTTQ